MVHCAAVGGAVDVDVAGVAICSGKISVKFLLMH